MARRNLQHFRSESVFFSFIAKKIRNPSQKWQTAIFDFYFYPWNKQRLQRQQGGQMFFEKKILPKTYYPNLYCVKFNT
jgi:hypothetical protein